MHFSEEKIFLTVKDHSVSKETFSLLYNEELDMLKTHPSPSLDVLGKYYESEDYISHTDSKRSMFEKLYHLVKSKALQDKVGLITHYGVKGQLLDIGCGTGDFLVTANNQAWNVKGFEPNEQARNLAKNKNIQLLDDLESIPESQFDVITMWHVLEHVPNLEDYMANLKRILKPNGLLVVAVPNHKSYDAKHYKEFWAAYDVPRHLWHFSKTSIKKLFAPYNLDLFHVKPMWFDSFYVSLLSEKYKTGKMNFISGFWNGLVSNLSGLIKKEYSSHIYLIRNNKK